MSYIQPADQQAYAMRQREEREGTGGGPGCLAIIGFLLVISFLTSQFTGIGFFAPDVKALPEPFIGTWTGKLRESQGQPTYAATIKLAGGNVGTVVGTFSYGKSCTGDLQLVDENAGVVTVQPMHLSRPACDGNLISLSLADDNQLRYAPAMGAGPKGTLKPR